MSEPTIVYQSSETQYWYGEGGSLLCRYKPELWREGYSSETFGVSQHETELVKAIILATQRAEAAEAEKYAYKYVPHLHGYLMDNGILPNDIVRTICSSQHQHQGAMSAVAALAESHELLRAERDALREDAARLDWLESRSSFLVHQWQGGGYTLTLPQPPIDGVRPPPIGVAGDAFRQAIDAAMAVQP